MPTFAPPRLIGSIVLTLLLTVTALALPARGHAAPGPLPLVVTPSPVSFPTTTVNEKSNVEVDVFNEGEDTTIEKIAIEGGDSNDFSTPNNACNFLPEGGHCTVTISFGPGGTGEKHSTAWIRFSGGVRSEESFELNGTGVSPHLSFLPLSYDFGLQAVNSNAASTTLNLENDGEGATRVNGVYFEQNVNGLWYDTNNCNNRLLQPKETCSVQIYFGPGNTGPYANTLRADAAGSSFTASVTGEGARPEVRASPDPADFGSLTAGSAGLVRTVTLTNTGLIPTGFFIAVISGGDSGSFHLVDENCTGHELQPSESCSAEVRFAPPSAGPKAATLAMFGDNDGGMRIPLLGEGLPASVSLTPSSYDFGHRAPGTKSVSRSFAVRNDGSGPLELDTASIVGSDPDQFVVSGDTCTDVTLAAGEQCLVKVRFAPDASGAKTAKLRVSGDAGPLNAALSGTGGAATAARVSFRWRGVSRKLRGGAALRIGSARCSGTKRCVVTVATKLGGVKLPKTRVTIPANRSKPLDVRVPKSVRERLDGGGARLSLKARWTAGGRAGNSRYSAIVR